MDGRFKGCKNCNLYYQSWLPVNEPKAILLVVHGIAEHCGRYENLVNYFVPRGYGIYGYDQRGHGKSDGLGGYVSRFSNFTEDLDIFLKMIHDRHPKAKIFLLGHSTGGTIASAYTIKNRNGMVGLILSGMLLLPPPDASAFTIFAGHVLSEILPKTGLYYINAETISRDRKVVDAYASDPLVYRGKIRARLGVELLKGMGMVRKKMAEIDLPVMIMHGAADRLSDPAGSKMLYQNTSSKDKTLKLYEGFFHEIMNEPGHEQVLNDLESWIRSHL